MEGMLIFLLEDGNAPENNFFLSLSLRLSESTNIVGVVIRCLELFTPHMSSIAETVKTKLTVTNAGLLLDARCSLFCFWE